MAPNKLQTQPANFGRRQLVTDISLAGYLSSFKLVGFPGTHLAFKHNPQIFSRAEVRTLGRLFQKLNVSLLYLIQNQLSSC